jgi:hypothetical protein
MSTVLIVHGRTTPKNNLLCSLYLRQEGNKTSGSRVTLLSDYIAQHLNHVNTVHCYRYNNVVNWCHRNPPLPSNVVPCEKSSMQWFLYKKFFNKPAKINSDSGIFHPVVIYDKIDQFYQMCEKKLHTGENFLQGKCKNYINFLDPFVFWSWQLFDNISIN